MIVPLCLIVGILAVCQWGVVAARAATVYSYIDDQGNPVFTDSPETIPEKYRAKVKTHERPDSVKKSPSVADTVRDTVKEQAKNFGFQMPSIHIDMKNFGLAPVIHSDLCRHRGDRPAADHVFQQRKPHAPAVGPRDC